MLNYISQFMPHAATITAPLTELTGDAEWLWTDLPETAFQTVNRAAEDHRVLRPIDYDNSDMIWLFTDASPTGMGAWIGQVPTRDAARPASFHSRKLTPAQRNYPHQQKLTLRLIRRGCVLTQVTSFLRPVHPVRPVLRRNHPLRPLRPDPPSNPPLRPDEISPRPGVLKTSQL